MQSSKRKASDALQGITVDDKGMVAEGPNMNLGIITRDNEVVVRAVFLQGSHADNMHAGSMCHWIWCRFIVMLAACMTRFFGSRMKQGNQQLSVRHSSKESIELQLDQTISGFEVLKCFVS